MTERPLTFGAGRILLLFAIWLVFPGQVAVAGPLRAGTGRCNITSPGAGAVHDSLYVKCLVLEYNGEQTALITLDVVALGTIGDIPRDFVPEVKRRLGEELSIGQVLINASHNHLDGFLNGGNKIAPDVEELTMTAVRKALENMEPVQAGAGTGSERSFAMNRRIKTGDGTVFTIRHAHPGRPDSRGSTPGATDPEIGILKLERMNGTLKAVVYNYTCHPYTGVPDKSVTAEFPGIASAIIEGQLGHGAMAFFLQGAAGDITEILYKDVNTPRSCVPFGNSLGLNVLTKLNQIGCTKKTGLAFVSERITLPLRRDIPELIGHLEDENRELVAGLRSTSLNVKTFIPLYIKYSLSPEFPSASSYEYQWEQKEGYSGLEEMDGMNRKDMDKYLRNILSMEKLSENGENIAQLKLKQDEVHTYGGDSVTVEVAGLRIGDFVVVTFPGEPFVQTGLDLKSASPFENTFLAGYTNGYIHYAPTRESYGEGGYETMNCILAPEWQGIYEQRVHEVIRRLR
jgi:hypothetical protein